MKRSIIICLLIFISSNAYSSTFGFSLGTGYKYNNVEQAHYFVGDIGITSFFRVHKSSSLGIDYRFTIGTASSAELKLSSLVMFSYRHYFLNPAPGIETTQKLAPFFTISFNNLIDNHTSYSPGIEVNIGFDIIFHHRVAAQLFDVVGYILSYAFNKKQTLTIYLFGAVYYFKQNVTVDAGIRFSSGILF